MNKQNRKKGAQERTLRSTKERKPFVPLVLVLFRPFQFPQLPSLSPLHSCVFSPIPTKKIPAKCNIGDSLFYKRSIPIISLFFSRFPSSFEINGSRSLLHVRKEERTSSKGGCVAFNLLSVRRKKLLCAIRTREIYFVNTMDSPRQLVLQSFTPHLSERSRVSTAPSPRTNPTILPTPVVKENVYST